MAQLYLSFLSNKHPSELLSPYFFPEKLKSMQVYKRITKKKKKERITRLVYKDHDEKLCICTEIRLNHL